MEPFQEVVGEGKSSLCLELLERESFEVDDEVEIAVDSGPQGSSSKGCPRGQ